MNRRNDLISAFIDFLLPHDCLVCGQEISGRQVCPNCQDYLPSINPPFCHTCGRPLKNGIRCSYCRPDARINRGRSWLVFLPPADRLIHHFKYRGKRSLAALFGRAMSLIVRSDHELAQCDLVVPVPLHWWRRLRRGYNQAFLIAREISRECDIEFADMLKRARNTRTQTRLPPGQRQKNVENAFAARPFNLKDRNVLLVDDVMTTGATVNECGRILLDAGAKSVCSCVAAITPERTATP